MSSKMTGLKSAAVSLLVALGLVATAIVPAHAVDFTAPTFTGMSAVDGPDVGGNALHLTGTNWDSTNGITVTFTNAGTVTVPAASVNTNLVSNFSSVDILAPANLTGGASLVSITNSGGATTTSIGYTYYKSFPTYSATGATQGGTGSAELSLATSGSCANTTPCNFTPGATASAVINGNPLVGVTYLRGGNTSMAVHLPAHTPTNHLIPDVATVTVQNSNGYTASSTYTYYQEPDITLPSTFTAPVNAAMSPITLGHPGGPCTSWSTSGTLPAGISWNQGAETISGTTNAAASPSNFSVTCNNPGGTSTATVSFGAAKSTQTVTAFTLTGATLVSAGSYSTTYGATAPVIHVTSNTGNAFTVTSSDPAVSVSGNIITILAPTSGAILTAHVNETSTQLASADVTITLAVGKATQSLSSFTLSGASGTGPSYNSTFGNNAITYGFTTSPSVGAGSVSIASSDACVTIGAGNSIHLTCVPASNPVTLTATLAPNTYYDGPVTRTLTLSIAQGQLGINFSPALIMVVGGVNQNLAQSTTLTPAGIGAPYAVTYSLDPASTPFCSLQGTVITAISTGTCTVRANAAGDANMLAAPIEIRNIDIKIYSQQILTFSGINASYQYGATDVNFAVNDLFGNPLIISSPNSTVVSLVQSGNSVLMHILGVGSTQITAYDQLTQATKLFTVTVTARAVSVNNLTATVSETGVVTFDPVPLTGVINSDPVTLDVSRVLATYSPTAGLTWTGTFGLTGFNSKSYYLISQPSSVTVRPLAFSVTPGVASLVGGNKVAINGIGFTAGTQVSFGSMAAVSVQVVNSTTIYAVTPVHNAGIVPVVIQVPGHGAMTTTNNLEFKALPANIISVSPPASNITGGAVIRINGENFTNDVTVTLGGQQVTVQSVTPNQITFVAPAHAAAKVALVVTNGGMDATTWSKDFVYSIPVSLDPHAQITTWTTGGTLVTITGSNFTAGLSVKVGAMPASQVKVLDDKTITFVVPATKIAGVSDITVTGTDGVPVTLSGSVLYVLAPSVTIAFAGKGTTLSSASLKAIARFVKTLAASPLKVKSISIVAYAPSAIPGLTALSTAIARAKSAQTATKAKTKKFKILVGAVAAANGFANQVVITVN
jgi:hypothetical protein